MFPDRQTDTENSNNFWFNPESLTPVRGLLWYTLVMREYTTKEKCKITAGAICAVVTVGLLAAIALAFLWTPPPP